MVIVKKLYIIDLEPAEREQLTALVEKGTVAAYRRRHAQILLLADQGAEGPAWRDAQVASHVGVTVQNVEKIRKRCVLEGLEAALGRRKRSRERATVLDGKGEAQLIAIACSEPPVGRARWTLHMLCDELKRRRIVRSISHETVRQVVKKNQLKPWRQEMWCIPPQENAAFVCNMENVLEVYTRPYDAAYRCGHRKGCGLAKQPAMTPSTSATGWDIC